MDKKRQPSEIRHAWPGVKQDRYNLFFRAGSIPKQTINSLLSAQKGSFYKQMAILEKKHGFPEHFTQWLIGARLRQNKQMKTFKELQALSSKKRVLEKVLKGHPREKYRIAKEIPETKQEIEQALNEINQKIHKILKSL